MYKITELTNQEITNLYEMCEAGWHYTSHPKHNEFMQAHNELPDYKS